MATKALQRLVRRAILARLKANSGVTTLVAAASIYGQDTGPNATMPLIRSGAATTRRLKAAGVNGGEVSLDLHAFARARSSGGQEVETAEDHCGRIGGAIETALEDVRLSLSDGSICRISISDTQFMRDADDPQAFHWFGQVNARVLAAT